MLLLSFYGLVGVFSPFVLEEFLNCVKHLLLEGLAVIVSLLQQPKELSKLITVVDWAVDLGHLYQNFVELSLDVRKYQHTVEESACHKEPLCVALRVKISKAYSSQ